MKRSGILAASLVFILVSVSAASACSRGFSERAVQTLVPASGIDYRLLDSAIRTEVNYHRCRAGLGQLSYAGDSLLRVAMKHSDWMARKNKLSHTNSIKGFKSLGDRVRSTNVPYRAAAENIVAVHQYQIDNKRFKIVDRRSCQFAINGKLVRAHSYASLARHSVNLWMDSPGHRKNILSPKVDSMAIGVAYSDTRKYCGKFWLTQNFLG